MFRVVRTGTGSAEGHGLGYSGVRPDTTLPVTSHVRARAPSSRRTDAAKYRPGQEIDHQQLRRHDVHGSGQDP
ncbi:hypothetical protein Rrhod_2195 [Rhodococcus rhodnii LMG 5362]|uniref:Uncharacterized protein n=1 Tax=Rhodococcus rhodnii LMG 5362 TaxID=1273125 RepID=R7WM70_9NOCA|nr:hypothetical protein Rrhod_2195 [Rhodococcus rhodnii LMG 5362]